MSINYSTLAFEATTTGANSKLPVAGNPHHTIQVDFTNTGGSVTALTVDLEGNLTGDVNKFAQYGSHAFTAGELTAKSAVFSVVNRPAGWVRSNITTLTATGTTKVNIYYLEGRE
ncbi:MAG: hypothetical protein NUV76_12220 [Candidatus Kuenenia sp.]|nr:hypothetical protein [Candidatus Kuenenia sp.]